ncbi:MAG: phosphoribosylformylglycinamidine synthase, partial [Patescibacteria group bacterium]
MIQTVRVISADEKEDSKGFGIFNSLKKLPVSKVRSSRLYRLEGIDKKSAKFLAEKLLSESINQKYFIDSYPFNNSSKSVEIAYKPGVMNPEAASIIKSAKDLGIKLAAADSSSEFYFFGKIDKGKTAEVVWDLKLFNPLIEYIVEKPPKTLLIEGRVGPTSIIPMMQMSDDDL